MSFGDIFLSETMGSAMLLLLGCGVGRQRRSRQDEWLQRRLPDDQLRLGPRRLHGRVCRVEERRPPEPCGDRRPAGLRCSTSAASATSIGRTSSAKRSAPSSVPPGLGRVPRPLRRAGDRSSQQARRLLDRPGNPQPGLERHHRGDRHRSCWCSRSWPSAAHRPRPASSARSLSRWLVVGIGASLGGPTGYAINPTRDLMPRIAHAVLPIKDKGDSNWGYSWVPVVGPLIGGAVAGCSLQAVNCDLRTRTDQRAVHRNN